MFNVYDAYGEPKKYYGLPILPSPAKAEMHPHYLHQIDENGNSIKGSSVPIHQKKWLFSYMEFNDISCEDPVCTCAPDSDCTQNGECPLIESFQDGEKCENDCLDWITHVGKRV